MSEKRLASPMAGNGRAKTRAIWTSDTYLVDMVKMIRFFFTRSKDIILLKADFEIWVFPAD